MRRWNGWGDEEVSSALPDNGKVFISERIGSGTPLPDATLAQVCATVPPSRLPLHPQVVTDAEGRVRHARGQSLPDWLAMRSGAFGFFPDGVAYPESSGDVRELLDWACQNGIDVIPYGGGTSVAGHITPVDRGNPVVTIDLGRMNRLLDLDSESRIARFGAGTPGPQVESQLRARGYTLGHFPQSFELSTLGGWVASRSSGQQSLRYGRIEQLFAGGRVEAPTGTLDIPTFPASSAGPDIREMVLGSEGRLGLITEVAVRVSPIAEEESFHVIFFPDWKKAKDAARALVQARLQLSMVRLSNPVETETQLALAGHKSLIAVLERFLQWRGAGPDKCMMTVGLTGSRTQCRYTLGELRKICRGCGGVYSGTRLGKKWAEKRFSMPYFRETLWQLGYAVDTLETATDWENVDILHDKMEQTLRNGLAGEDERVHVFTHLSHVYSQGCSLYTTYVYRLGASYEQAYQRWQHLKHSTSEAIVQHRGTISHQHGVGKDHAPYLRVEKGELGMSAIRDLMRSFDPDGRLNPGTLLAQTPKPAPVRHPDTDLEE